MLDLHLTKKRPKTPFQENKSILNLNPPPKQVSKIVTEDQKQRHRSIELKGGGRCLQCTFSFDTALLLEAAILYV